MLKLVVTKSGQEFVEMGEAEVARYERDVAISEKEAAIDEKRKSITEIDLKISTLETKALRPSREITLAQSQGLDAPQEAVDALQEIEAELLTLRTDKKEAEKALQNLTGV